MFNATFDENERRWKALQARRMYDAIRYGTAALPNELARRVQQIGFRIQPAKHGFEIEGVKVELLRRFSKRAQQRDAVIKEMEAKLGRKLSNGEISPCGASEPGQEGQRVLRRRKSGNASGQQLSADATAIAPNTPRVGSPVEFATDCPLARRKIKPPEPCR